MRTWTVLVAAALLVCLTACTPESGEGSSSDRTGDPAGVSTTGSDGTGSGSVSDPSPSEAPQSGDSSGSGATDGPGTGSLGQSGGDGSEVLPEATGAPTSLADLLEDSPGAAELTTAPPNQSDAGIVEAFPTDVILVPSDFEVLSSSVSSDGTRVQAALDATAASSCADLLIAYRSWFTRGDFAETTTSETADHAQLTFTRGTESATLSTTTEHGGCTIALIAVLEVQA